MAEPGKPDESRPFTFKVNGVQIDVKRQTLLAREILELASKHGAMPGKPEDYLLQGDKGRYGLDDEVDLEQDNIFITIPNTPTPVA